MIAAAILLNPTVVGANNSTDEQPPGCARLAELVRAPPGATADGRFAAFGNKRLLPTYPPNQTMQRSWEH